MKKKTGQKIPKGTFPPSWRKWRVLKEGERIIRGDRVWFSGWLRLRDASRHKSISAHQLRVPVHHKGSDYMPEGCYFRRIK